MRVTITIQQKPSATLDDATWFDAFYRGKHIAQTVKTTAKEGIPELTRRAKAALEQELGQTITMGPPKILDVGQMHTPDYFPNHED